jgi:hypothetical protein
MDPPGRTTIVVWLAKRTPLVLCGVILGFATTVAVAWTIEVLPRGGQTPRAPMVAQGIHEANGMWWVWSLRRHRGELLSCLVFPTEQEARRTLEQWLRGHRAMTPVRERAPVWAELRRLTPASSTWPDVDWDQGRYLAGTEYAVGWPFPALASASRIVGGTEQDFWAIKLPASFASHPPLRDRMLPIRPLWPGIAVNTALCAVGWVGLFLAIGVAHRWWRRKRGRCARCGYDLTGLGERPCPECGSGATFAVN